MFLEALADPNHEYHDDYVAWIGAFEPDQLDLERINAKLARRGGKRRTRKSNRASDAT